MREALFALAAAIALSLAAPAHGADLYVGAVVLPVQGYTDEQCSTLLPTWRGIRRPSLSFVWSSFGDDLACVMRWLKYTSRRRAMVNIYATNETCRHKPRVCTQYDQPKDIRARALELAAFASIVKRVGLRIVIHPCGLEDDRGNSSCARRLAIFREVLPTGVEFGRNPDAPRDLSFNGFNFREFHRLHEDYRGPRYLFTSDGFDLSLGGTYQPIGHYRTPGKMLAQIRRARGDLAAVLIWWNNQGSGGPGKRFVQPRRRRFRVHHSDVAVVNGMLRRIQSWERN